MPGKSRSAGKEDPAEGPSGSKDYEEPKEPDDLHKAIEGDFGTRPKKAKEEDEKIEEMDKNQRLETLKKFTEEALKKHGQVIRSIVLFGSTARGTERGESDIDMFVILDDTRQKLSPAMIDNIDYDLVEIAKKHSKLLSLQQPYTLTEFWRLVREGHPIVFNFIREGVPVYDRDIFIPIKRLLQMGEIKPSKEAVEKFIDRGPQRLSRVKSALTYMVVEDCYYAMIESAQAVLMFLGRSPPRPSEVCGEMRKNLVEMKFLDESIVKYLEDIIHVRKEVEHKRMKDLTGAQLDEWLKKSEDFVKKMQDLIVKIEVLKRENMIEKSYAIMAETTMTLLKALNKVPPKTVPIRQAFEETLVKPGLVSDKYLYALDELEKMRVAVKEGKVLDLPKNAILAHREYVRKFIREAGKVLKDKKLKIDTVEG